MFIVVVNDKLMDFEEEGARACVEQVLPRLYNNSPLSASYLSVSALGRAFLLATNRMHTSSIRMNSGQ